MKKVLLLISILLLACVCFAQQRPNWVSFERTGSTGGTIRWSSEPSTNVGYYYLGLYPTETKYYPPAYCDPSWNIPGGYVSEFIPEAPGVLKKDVGGLDPTKDYYAYVAAVETNGWSWAAYSSWETDEEPPAAFTYKVNSYDLAWYSGNGYEFPTNQPAFLDANDLVSEILFNGDSFSPPAFTPYIFGAQGNHPFVAGTYSVVKPGYISWLPDAVVFGSITTNYETDFLGIPDDNTPVELSSFTAALTANNYVQLTWVSQTETNMLGYRVYRNDSENQASSVMITPTLIPATNVSSQQSYTVTDPEVVIGQTYYYWLESVDVASSQYFGPLSINVEGEVPPVNPEVSSMKQAYPNPFKANDSTTIEVAIKGGETGTVTVYNLLGQVVRTFNVSEGTHTINWNGKDSKGAACSSGIYFYKLSTPSINQTQKMVIIK
jgi:hypothetical protein